MTARITAARRIGGGTRHGPTSLCGMRPMDLTLAPRTDPTSIYRSRDGLYADDLLITALVHLDLFSWIAGRGSDGVYRVRKLRKSFQTRPPPD